MLNLIRVKAFLSLYGVVWLSAFAASLGAVVLAKLLGLNVIGTADMVLGLTLGALALALLAFFVAILMSRETGRTKLVLGVMGLLLGGPLLWSPVLGVAGGAAIAGSAIEYSGVYAAFRIAFGRLSYALTETILGSPVVEAAWSFMQGLAAVIGFLAALGQLWRLLRSMAGQSQA